MQRLRHSLGGAALLRHDSGYTMGAMVTRRQHWVWAWALGGAALLAAGAQPVPPASATAPAKVALPFLHPLFADHAVLQRDQLIPVWGWTTPGASVTVRVERYVVTAAAGPDGRWEALVGPLAAGGPTTLTVDGPRHVQVADVLIGDVWLCGGQSNMVMGMGEVGAPEDVAGADYPRIRLLTVPPTTAPRPWPTVGLRWRPCTPDNVSAGMLGPTGNGGGFSAVGFYFGRTIFEQTRVPLGLIQSCASDTSLEAWTPRAELGAAPTRAVEPVLEPEDRAASLEQWLAAADPGSAQQWRYADPARGFQGATFKVPRLYAESELEFFRGVAWFQRGFELTQVHPEEPSVLRLTALRGVSTVWLNGVPLGSGFEQEVPGDYPVPPGVLRRGSNRLVVRLVNFDALAGFRHPAGELTLLAPGAVAAPEPPPPANLAPPTPTPAPPATPTPAPAPAPPGQVRLAGLWACEPTVALAELPELPDWLTPELDTRAGLYNAMIAPLAPFALRGVAWYEGDQSIGRDAAYPALLKGLIADWRRAFRQPELPFALVQLAGYGWPTEQLDNAVPQAQLREAQYYVARTTPQVAATTAIDVGETNQVHAWNKRAVGQRLAAVALARWYDRPQESEGPAYRGALALGGGRLRLFFDHAESGLYLAGDAAHCFALAGDDGRWEWAQAEPQGSTVVLYAARVAAPLHVRYAFQANPAGLLYNRAGLPAWPFRTDGPLAGQLYTWPRGPRP